MGTTADAVTSTISKNCGITTTEYNPPKADSCCGKDNSKPKNGYYHSNSTTQALVRVLLDLSHYNGHLDFFYQRQADRAYGTEISPTSFVISFVILLYAILYNICI